jgi:hypothetical protein
MLKKNDITGFEKEYLWVDVTNDRVFQFYLDNTGTMNVGDLETAIRWEYLGENETPKNTLKIGVDGSIFYFIFKEIDGENFKVLYKSKTKSEPLILARIVKHEKSTTKVNVTDTEVLSATADLPTKVKFNIKEIETSDKIFFSFMYLVSMILMSVLLKSSSFFGNMSFIMLIFISIIATALIFIQLKDVLFYVSKKYKKEIEDIIFKK